MSKVRSLTAGVIALFVGGVVVHEGLPIKADGKVPVYIDSAGVRTTCYGETKNLTKEFYTVAECEAMLGESTKYYAKALDGLPPLPVVVYVGALDFTYNAGRAAFAGSSIKQCLLKEDYACASEAVLNWRYISKKSITAKDKSYGVWKWNGKKYMYDCSQLVNGKPNKLCTGLWERRKYQSLMLGNKLTPEQAQEVLKYYY